MYYGEEPIKKGCLKTEHLVIFNLFTAMFMAMNQNPFVAEDIQSNDQAPEQAHEHRRLDRLGFSQG